MAPKGLALPALLAGLALVSAFSPTVASAAPDHREVRYRGHSIKVPASWPVYRLSAAPARCVRLDRKAVYLGRPRSNQRCPAHVVGRAEAILVEPLRGATVRVTRGKRRIVRGAHDGNGKGASRAPAHRDRLGRRTARRPRAVASSIYTGLGFDACSAPSATTLSAWASSPYRAVGIYIGGVNRACSQPNLTSTWVAGVLASGWVLIPTYVGLQAPVDVCGCASIKPAIAATQGIEAADDAVATAAALGIGPGNPIYYDMEGYSTTSTNTGAVLTFLEAWTGRLHELGYVSGVYGSAASTISDLVDAYPTPYLDPDHIWVANWNGLQTTADPYVPASYWSNHQRIHQYRGGHNETWGGVTINVDNNYLDGAVVGVASRPVLRTRLRCRRVLLKRRPRQVAMRVRAFNMLSCGKARKVANRTRLRRHSPDGRDRGYVKRRFRCLGIKRSDTKVVYTCRRAFTKKRSRAKIRFVRRG